MTENQRNKVQILYDWANGEYDSVPKSKMLHFTASDSLKDIVALVDKGYKKVLPTQVVIDKDKYLSLLSSQKNEISLSNALSLVLKKLSNFIDNESAFISGKEVEMFLDRLAKVFQEIKGDIENGTR